MKKLIHAAFFLLLIPLASARTVTIQGTAPLPTPVSWQNTAVTGGFTPKEVDSYVRHEAAILGVNPVVASFIVSHESQDGRNMVGHEPNGTISYGYWQLNDENPNFNQACAMDLHCSTQFSLAWILDGQIERWSTWRYRCAWYPKDNPPNCP